LLLLEELVVVAVMAAVVVQEVLEVDQMFLSLVVKL
jgi:hypothetical protein|tara:strand:+ start:170 stop:277 length:108 start_codon:yes stop_codon:yes gene_type:complete